MVSGSCRRDGQTAIQVPYSQEIRVTCSFSHLCGLQASKEADEKCLTGVFAVQFVVQKGSASLHRRPSLSFLRLNQEGTLDTMNRLLRSQAGKVSPDRAICGRLRSLKPGSPRTQSQLLPIVKTTSEQAPRMYCTRHQKSKQSTVTKRMQQTATASQQASCLPQNQYARQGLKLRWRSSPRRSDPSDHFALALLSLPSTPGPLALALSRDLSAAQYPPRW